MGALHYARELGATVALITGDPTSEAAHLADIVIAPDTGAEVVVGYGRPKASLVQAHILGMISTGLAVRSGRTYGNLRVDIEASSTRWAERQIAIVMAAGCCSRAQAKAALEDCNHHCKTAILMVLTGLNAFEARKLLNHHHGYLRMALQEAPRA